MPSNPNERAFEEKIELTLTGTSLERIRAAAGTVIADTPATEAPPEPWGNHNGYQIGTASDFNAQYAVDEAKLFAFLEHTQGKELVKLKKHSDWKLRILGMFDKRTRKYGLLRQLRKGLDVDECHFTLLYEVPLANSSQAVHDGFAGNIFSVTRQVRYNLEQPGQEIDMVIFVNGLPLLTMELKYPWKHQTAKVHGRKQYRTQRDHRQPLLQFGRCLVHFAVDTNEVWMTTHLRGDKTDFLPFNKGRSPGRITSPYPPGPQGAGNPPNPNGYPTDYLWREVFTRKSLGSIIQHFVRFVGFDAKPRKEKVDKAIFFPRYHQLNVVREIIADATKHGSGQRYLIQHSAGSGKSYSITWAAYQLIEVYKAGEDKPLFDSVIVVTDRRLLDKQLRDDIREFAQVDKLVAHAKTSQELRAALEGGKRIIITTIQKFPVIVDDIEDLSHKRFAVIIDEAHSSQSGLTAGKMNAAMGSGSKASKIDHAPNTDNASDTSNTSNVSPLPWRGAGGEGLEGADAGAENVDEQEPDNEDRINQSMAKRKMSPNASYLAFTATPKNATLERFGQPFPDGTYHPFHLYSMKQAIEEEFILDVLANYTTYRSYYQLTKSITDNPMYDTARAQQRLKAKVESDPRTVATKAGIITDHFVSNIYNVKRLNGKGKAMVVTQSIKSAILYFFAIRAELTKRGTPFKILVAFSGTKKVDGQEYTEAKINGFSEGETRKKFDTDEYRLLVVADKYLTGFDQKKLCAMYVDKRLQGVKAVQALSRLNRANKKLKKRTEDLFILDFFNTIDDIEFAFKDFYTATSLSEATDVNVLHELRDLLADYQVYDWPEVEAFNQAFFANLPGEELSPLIQPAARRFSTELDLTDEHKADFKIKAKQFVKIYGQVSSITDISRRDWEQLFWFLKFLIPELTVLNQAELPDDLLDKVDLSTYALERTHIGAHIILDEEAAVLDPQSDGPRGVHGPAGEIDTLDNILESFNDRWSRQLDALGQDPEAILHNFANQISDHADYETKVEGNNDPTNSKLAKDKIVRDITIQSRESARQLHILLKDEDFKRDFFAAAFEMAKRMRGEE
jgi:type I restriction enzyme R subunit